MNLLHLEALADAPSLTPKQLAAKHGDEAARWALMQLELRKRASKKFGELSTRMLFEREALEQATSLNVARYHASQFPSGVAVIDLTAGLGGDTLAIAERGSVIAYENDPARAELLEFNLKGIPDVSDRTGEGSEASHCRDWIIEVRLADGLSALLTRKPCTLERIQEPGGDAGDTFDYVWADPDRRSDTGRRLSKPEDYSPNPSELAIRLKESKLAGIKLSPLLPDDYLESLGGSLEFISHQGECLEAIIWLGTENTKPKRQAVILHAGEEPTRIQSTPISPPQAFSPKKFIHDCDPAVVRAHCLGALGHDHLGDSPGYLTSDDPTENAAYRTYEVLATATPNQLKSALRNLGGSVFELKQRGTKLDPGTVLKGLKSYGDKPVSLIAYREDKSIRYALTTRLG